jgi:hypothetical protein
MLSDNGFRTGLMYGHSLRKVAAVEVLWSFTRLVPL